MFLDVGIGILLSVFISRIFGADLSYGFVLAGVGFSLLPDLDVFVELAKRGRIGGRVQGHHRELTHFPLTYLPAIFLIYAFWGQVYVWLFAWAVLAHFLHDSVGMGWGLQWLWPFSRKAYKFFSNKDGSLSGRFLVSWAPAELREVVYRHGDDHWFKNYYLNPHPIAIFEFMFFVFAILVLFFTV